MKKGILALLMCLGFGFSGAAAAAGSTGNVNLFLGGKTMDEDEWLANEHGEVGVMIDFGGQDWPVLIAVDLLRSSGDFNGYVYTPFGIDYYEEDVKTREMDIGVRKYWDIGSNMFPYLGGGLAFVKLEATGQYLGQPAYSASGSGTGLWIGGGIQWGFDQFNIGFDIRGTGADVELDGIEYKAGGGHTALILGYHW